MSDTANPDRRPARRVVLVGGTPAQRMRAAATAPPGSRVVSGSWGGPMPSHIADMPPGPDRDAALEAWEASHITVHPPDHGDQS